MNRTRIEWCDFSWNPVTGCRRGCSYYYAKRMYERFSHGRSFCDIVVHRGRFSEPERLREPATIFVGSMSDIEYWPTEVRSEIVGIARSLPRHTFMFLSKSAGSYSGEEWPANTRQGLTLTCEQDAQAQARAVEAIEKYPRPYLSLEPLLGPLRVDVPRSDVIVGAQTGPGAVTPGPEWLGSIERHVPNVRVFWKNSIKFFWEKSIRGELLIGLPPGVRHGEAQR